MEPRGDSQAGPDGGHAAPAPASTRLPPVTLASTSPRRRELLGQVIDSFEVVDSGATELHGTMLPPRALCEANARRKAMAVSRLRPGHLVLGADTLVFLDDQPLGKPADMDEARAMLRRLSGRTHAVITGVCLVHQQARRMACFAEATHVRFKALGEEVIEAYLRAVPVLDKAGSYALQSHGDWLVERLEGSFSNVVGLPVERLREALGSWIVQGTLPPATP